MAVLTVSREYGSCGEHIARQVADQLGYSYFNKEILAEVAQLADTTEDKIRAYDEKDEHGLRHFLKQLFLPDYPRFVDYPYYPGIAVEVSREMVGEAPTLSEQDVASFFRHAVEALWKRGNIVIVGRGSQRILATKPNVLHIRFVAARSERARRVIADEEILDLKDALEKIEAIDAQRAHYLKRYYDVNWEDARLYHLVINTSLMPAEHAAQTVITAVRHLEEAAGQTGHT